MKALVTGSAGFVGRNLVVALTAEGYEVTDHDLADGRDCCDVFRYDDTRFDLVVHCAAVVGGRRLIDGTPAHLLAYNAMLDASMFEWAMRTGAGQVVYYSSSAAYPVSLQLDDARWMLREDDIDLDSPERPETSYGQAKLNGEQIARYARDEGLRVHVLRPFSGYGEGQDLDYPWPSFVARARARRDPFDVWGDGTQVRDWVHIDDIVGATLAAVAGDEQVTANLCTGVGTDFNALAKLACEAAGYSPQIRHITTAARGVDYRVGDPSALHAFYRPAISVAEGITRALDAA